MSLRGPQSIHSTITVGNGIGAIAPIASFASGAPSGGFIKMSNASGFGFRGTLSAGKNNSGSVALVVTIADSLGALQTYTRLLLAAESTGLLEDVDLATIQVYGSAASQLLNVDGEH